MNNPSVSILTITQLSRSECLFILIDIIKEQTYKNIIEWVLVEGSKNIEDAKRNQEFINQLIADNKDVSFKIIYVEYSGMKLGGLRNKSNQNATGDIMVCMDDDDYYFPTRVEHCVEQLMASDKLIAGNTNMYMHDYIVNMTVEANMIKTHGPNHATNNTMAYKRAYLSNHFYDNNAQTAEEASFTNKFSEPMIQLDKDNSVILNSHHENTFNKREIVINSMLFKTDQYKQVSEEKFKELMPNNYYERYRKLFYKEQDDEYDIVYYAGGHSIVWDPEDKSLGGSEQAIVNLCKNWTLIGKKVAVYGHFTNDKTIDGVDYFIWKRFPYNHKFKTLILWRFFGLLLYVPFNVRADKVILDLHDNVKGSVQTKQLYLTKPNLINEIYFKSEYQKQCFENFMGIKLKEGQYRIIPNGIRVKEFSDNTIMNDGKPIIRNPYRFVYASCYTRGLLDILTKVWALIYKVEPRAEFHIYYGMDLIQDEELKNKLKQAMNQLGVMDHGRQSSEIVAREKYMSSFHLYLSQSEAEIDCISIRESLVTGCIPLLSYFGVFANRDGVHYNWDPNNEQHCKKVAEDIINLMKNKEFVAKAREQLRKSKLIIDWMETALTWL